MFTPDRKPHPAVEELKFLQQPAWISHRNASSGTLCVVVNNGKAAAIISIENLNSFTDLSYLSWTWELRSNRSSEPMRHGRFRVDPKPSMQLVTITLDEVVSRIHQLERTRPYFGNKFWLHVRANLACETTWAPKGHPIVHKQLPIEFKFTPSITLLRKPETVKDTNTLKVERVGGSLHVMLVAKGQSSPLVSIDEKSGELLAFSPFGENLLANRVTPSFSRAFTDNDKGGMEFLLVMMFPTWFYQLYRLVMGTRDFSYSSHWKMHGLVPEEPPIVDCVRARVTDASSPHKVGIVVLSSIFSSNRKICLFKVRKASQIVASVTYSTIQTKQHYTVYR